MTRRALLGMLSAMAGLAGCRQSMAIRARRSSPAFEGVNVLDPAKIQRLLDNGLDPESQNNSPYNQDTLLYYAVRMRATDTVAVLVKAGAQVDRRSSGFKKTALFQAAYNGDIPTARLLLQAGADINATDMFGEQCIREAILARHPDMVKFLLEAGLDTSHRNSEGQTAADLAFEHGNDQIKKLLPR